MIESSRLIRPTRGVRLTRRGLGFPARRTMRTLGPRILLVDPDAIPGVFTELPQDGDGSYIRHFGMAADDFGGPRSGPVWWEEPYLVWAVSRHRDPPAAPPRGAKLVARALRSESGRIAVVPLNPKMIVGKAVVQARWEGRGCYFRLPCDRWSLFYLQHDPPAGMPAEAARDVVLRYKPPRPAPPTGPWLVEIDLDSVQTPEQFFDEVGRRLLLERRRPEGKFWLSFDQMVRSRSHTGMLTVRLVGWTAFERRLPETAQRWRKGIRYLRTTCEHRFVQAEYDDPPRGPALPTRRCCVLLAAGSDLTLPALAARLRDGRPRMTVEEASNRLNITGGGLIVHIGQLTDPAELAEIRNRQFVDDFVQTPMPGGEAEADEVAAAPEVLEVWTASPNPWGRSQSRVWAAVLRTVESFRRAYLTDEEPEHPDG
jgi:hypothetical protein